MGTTKIFSKNIKNKSPSILFFIAFLSLSFSAQGAKRVAFVTKIDGQAFYMKDGQALNVKKGDVIEDLGEVVTEVGSQLSLEDYAHHWFHLSGATHVKFLNKIVELKKGAFWIQSKNNAAFEVQTSNAVITYWTGEGVISHDAELGKTQLLTIAGSMEFSNLVTRDHNVVLDPGLFSYIESDGEEMGLPRRPTPIGKKSYDQFTSLFPGVSALSPVQFFNMGKKAELAKGQSVMPTMVGDEDDLIDNMVKSKMNNEHQRAVKREVASTTTAATTEGDSSAGEITVRKLPKEVEIKPFDVNKYMAPMAEKVQKERAMRKKAFHPDYSKKSAVVVKVYGMGVSSSPSVTAEKSSDAPKTIAPTLSAETSDRAPASVAPAAVAAPASTKIEKSAEFESTLLDQYKNQMRHSDEKNNLIRDLKNYSQDFQKNY